jgi:hypothetical protein
MGSKLSFRIALAAALTVPLPAAFSQAPRPPAVTLVEPPAPLLPKQFGAWQQQTDNAAAGQPSAAVKDVLIEDGLARFAASTYKRDNGGEMVDIKAFQFGDTTGAFSAFTYLRAPDFRRVRSEALGNEAAEKDDSVVIWSGPDVVLAEFHGGRRSGELGALVAVLPKATGAKGLPPLLPTMVPEKGLEAESLRYSVGSAGYEATGGILPASVIGFDKSAEVATAKYAGRGMLTMLLYPTPQIAGDHGRQIEAELNREVAAGKDFGTIKLRREGPLLLLATGGWKPAEARAIIEGTHLRDQLSWNKPLPLEFHAEVQKTASLLLSIAELSGALMVAALVMGLFFGGGRAMLRVLQGKPAAIEPEFLAINLREAPGEGGSFKRLH